MSVDIRITPTRRVAKTRAPRRETIECSCSRANLNIELMPDFHTPETHLLAQCLKDSLQRAVEQLPLLEQYVLGMYWGIGHDRPMSFAEICLHIGGSERGAKRIFRSGMKRLRRAMMRSIIFERSDKLLLTQAVCEELSSL